ncbi:MAG TPA: bifunctional hydroxymethylpyrimidine kinase/phosphomethylpyrimidine kinase [Bryobacteraceae bacterium]|nr:bifunctional hydroxymethylpyrimidine kinase/phosphomethylpyrimidine kinase [Bryobacteraceae bacterium]
MSSVALTIAGSDPSGGAGIQADLKTFHQFGVYGEAVVTLLTVQNTVRTDRVEVMPPELVFEQIRAVLDDIPPAALKTGSLGSAEVVHAVARALEGYLAPLVIDPVLINKHGVALASESAWTALESELLPHAALLTPNVPEAEALTGIRIQTPEDMRKAALRLREMGARDVLIKGGHLAGPPTDVLLVADSWHEFRAPRLETRHTHGTGCAYSAAITACLARGMRLRDAVARAKQYINEAIRTAPGLGHGSGPVNHHAETR